MKDYARPTRGTGTCGPKRPTTKRPQYEHGGSTKK